MFFKQKTAYEMRISDWSSDVCSSDLLGPAAGAGTAARGGCVNKQCTARYPAESACRQDDPSTAGHQRLDDPHVSLSGGYGQLLAARFDIRCQRPRSRSEEHTSELPSLMRISYAVFCLKKKQ